MNRNTKTIMAVLAIIVAMLVLSVIAYYVGTVLAHSFISTGGTKLHEWQHKYYFTVVRNMGIASGLFSLAWLLFSRFLLKVNDAVGAGKRTVWMIFLLLDAVACFIVPYVYHSMYSAFTMSISISILFLFLYPCVGYWFVSIFTTPDAFKYTPIGASVFRQMNRK